MFTKPFLDPPESPIRALFKHLARPEVISFANGQPGNDVFDSLGLKEALVESAQRMSGRLEYGETQGLPALRVQLANLMVARGIHCAPKDIFVTTGSQQAIDLLLRVLVSPGDIVLVEEPAYPTTIHALRLAMADIHPVGMDEQGITLDALRPLLARLSTQGKRPKLLYTVPNFSNPTGRTLSFERRLAVLALAEEYGFLIIEDDPYGMLRFTGSPLESMAALSARTGAAATSVIYVSSLSKTLAPGLRIGWMIAPEEIKRRCVIAKQSGDICTPLVCQQIAEHCLQSGFFEQALPQLIAIYKQKQELMLRSLTDSFGSQLDVTRSEGGIFLWPRWTSDVDTDELLSYAVEEGVLYVPGAAFFIADADRHCFRMSFAASTPAQIEQGIRRLARARERFGTRPRC